MSSVIIFILAILLLVIVASTIAGVIHPAKAGGRTPIARKQLAGGGAVLAAIPAFLILIVHSCSAPSTLRETDSHILTVQWEDQNPIITFETKSIFQAMDTIVAAAKWQSEKGLGAIQTMRFVAKVKTVDKYGNDAGLEEAFSVLLKAEDLKKINWDKIDDHGIFRFFAEVKGTRFGTELAEDYCGGSWHTEEQKLFCLYLGVRPK